LKVFLAPSVLDASLRENINRAEKDFTQRREDVPKAQSQIGLRPSKLLAYQP